MSKTGNENRVLSPLKRWGIYGYTRAGLQQAAGFDRPETLGIYGYTKAELQQAAGFGRPETLGDIWTQILEICFDSP